MERRTILQALVGALYAAVAAGLGGSVLRFLLAPLRVRSGARGFVRAWPLDELAADRPVRAVLSGDRWDAFIRHPPGPIGSVWLVRRSDGGSDGLVPVRCLQTICPHLGCGIDFAAGRGAFVCPCHASEFDLSGQSRFGPSPRGMDELECRISDPDESGRRWVEVRYEEFRTGVSERQPQT